ncbi:hypothetical protein Taro_046812 [Colocasia esculenta]|uniref:Uncharacterized protein n=1 Tax=Colocasia esculenta TaxID=4460 RepID=A0A843WTG1_COLES|nr:hypothetical protein [Colocasia esculenta]
MHGSAGCVTCRCGGLVRESRRLLALHLVLSCDVAGLGLHHQQCNFLTLYTSGQWTPKVAVIEKANDLLAMSMKKFIGSLMAHEINIERLCESSTKKKISNALKAKESISDEVTKIESSEIDNKEEALLSRR